MHERTLTWLISGFHSTDRFEKIFKKYNKRYENLEKNSTEFLGYHTSQKTPYDLIGVLDTEVKAEIKQPSYNRE